MNETYLIVAENRILFRKTEKQMKNAIWDLMDTFGKQMQFEVEKNGIEIPKEQLGLFSGSIGYGDNFRKEFRGRR